MKETFQGPGPRRVLRALNPSPAFDAWGRASLSDAETAVTFCEAYARGWAPDRAALRESIRALRDGHDHAKLLSVLMQIESVFGAESQPDARAFAEGERSLVSLQGAGFLLLDEGDAQVRFLEAKPPGAFEPCALEPVVTRVAAALWRSRREGRAWPEELSRFVELFV